jgi:type I restriction enzyme S subunit
VKQFRQSVLAAAFRGDLTADWRDQHPDVEDWKEVKLNNVVKQIKAGKNFKCPEIPVTSETVGLVKISAVTWGKFDPKETKTVQDKSKIDESLFIKLGDFLISRANTIELVGASVIVNSIDHKIMLSDKIWRVTFNELCDQKFIDFYLKSKRGRQEIESRATGNQLSMRNISQKSFRDINIRVVHFSAG